MQLGWIWAAAAAAASSVLAQSSTLSGSASASQTASAGANATAAANSTLRYITTTITSLVSSGTASPSPTTFVLTLTLNSTAFQNGTVTNTTTGLNNTAITNGTSVNATEPWKAGDDWIPFAIPIDPTYGVLGAFLIITGIPVAVLGGKNRWTSLAVVSGYTLMLFSLIMVLRFGVQPNIQPPSPNPPSSTLRGLYLLACIISSFIGAAIGIFFFKFAKYWVAAAGGFAFGWFLLAVKAGGLITSALGRWGLLGGLTVAMFVASLPEKLNPWMVLIATAWIGATAFVLGIDCYVRGGLKEFYIYNLGYWDLFEPLGEAPYPLTQTMQIELGILAAVVIIGAAIQFRVLNILQKRLKEFKEEEEARIEAEEVSKAAERFKSVGTDLEEWEEKHGKYRTLGSGNSRDLDDGQPGIGSGSASLRDVNRSTVALPRLDFDDEELRAAATAGPSSFSRPRSELSLLVDRANQDSYQHLPLSSPGLESRSDMEVLQPEQSSAAAQASNTSPTGTDPELESKMRLLEEVKRAREEVRSSLDMLRQKTPSLYSVDAGRNTPGPSSAGLEDPRYTSRMSTSSLRLLDDARDGRGSSTGQLNDRASGYFDQLTPAPAGAATFANVPPPVHAQPMQPARPLSDWDKYTQERRIASVSSPATDAAPRTRVSSGPLLGQQASHPRLSMVESRSANFDSALGRRSLDQTFSAHPDDRRMSTLPGRPSTYYDSPNAPIIVGSANSGAGSRQPGDYAAQSLGHGQGKRASMTRTMTVDELSERHRQRLSKLQDPISSKMKEEAEVAAARAWWERQKRFEKEDMKRREEEKMERLRDVAPGSPPRDRRRSGAGDDSRGRMEEWRRSVQGISGLTDGSNATPVQRGESSRRMSQGPAGPVPHSRGQDLRTDASMPRKRGSRHFAS